MSYQRSVTENHLYVYLTDDDLCVHTPTVNNIIGTQGATLRFIKHHKASRDNAKVLITALQEYLKKEHKKTE